MKFRWVNRDRSEWVGLSVYGKAYHWDTVTDLVSEGIHTRNRRGSTVYERQPVTKPELVQQIKEAMKQHETN